MKKYFQITFILLTVFFLSGCAFFEWLSGACEWADDEHTRSHCYQGIGVYTDTPEVCEDASYGGTRTKCYIKLAQRQGDGSYCDYIGENEGPPNYTREQCYQAVAIETGDPEYCEKMGGYSSGGNDISGGSGYSRENCLAAVGPVDEEDEEDDMEEEGECKYDSDCDAICEGDVYWKMGCDARTNTCIKTFDTNCADEKTEIGIFDFPQLCSADVGCVDNKGKIVEMKTALSEQAKAWQTLMQNVETARRKALDNCLSALSDVTNKFIIDSAITFSGIAGVRVNTSYQSMADFSKYIQPGGSEVASIATAQVTGPVQQLLDTLGSIAVKDVTGEQPKMPVDQYIALHCNAAKTLQAEYDRMVTERDGILMVAAPFKGW